MSLISEDILIEPSYYYREFENDLSCYLNLDSWLPVAKRVGKVVLPFLSLYKPLNYPITLSLSITRVCKHGQEFLLNLAMKDSWKIAVSTFKTCWAFAALLGTLLLHSVGMMLTTCLDFLESSVRMVQHLCNQEYVEAFIKFLSVFNNAFYLALFFHGGTGLVIASLTLQLFICLVLSIDQFRKGNLLEGGAHALMAFVRGGNLAQQFEIAYKNAYSISIPQEPLSTIPPPVDYQGDKHQWVEFGQYGGVLFGKFAGNDHYYTFSFQEQTWKLADHKVSSTFASSNDIIFLSEKAALYSITHSYLK